VIVLLRQGHAPAAALGVGVLLGLLPKGVIGGLSAVMAPGWVIRRRERTIAENASWRRPIHGLYSQALAIEGPHPWDSSTARQRVRLYGLVRAAVCLLGMGVLVLILPLMDQALR